MVVDGDRYRDGKRSANRTAEDGHETQSDGGSRTGMAAPSSLNRQIPCSEQGYMAPTPERIETGSGRRARGAVGDRPKRTATNSSWFWRQDGVRISQRVQSAPSPCGRFRQARQPISCQSESLRPRSDSGTGNFRLAVRTAV